LPHAPSGATAAGPTRHRWPVGLARPAPERPAPRLARATPTLCALPPHRRVRALRRLQLARPTRRAACTRPPFLRARAASRESAARARAPRVKPCALEASSRRARSSATAAGATARPLPASEPIRAAREPRGLRLARAPQVPTAPWGLRAARARRAWTT
jgi:hypothetical protein